MYSKLITYLIVAQLSAHIFAAAPTFDADFRARREKDLNVLDKVSEAGDRCSIYPLLKAIEYFTERCEQEQDPDYRELLHHYISGIYVHSLAVCANNSARYEMLLAFQAQLVDISRKKFGKK